MKKINIGLIGLGTVGAGVVKTLKLNSHLISARSGIKINLKKIVDINFKKDREISLDSYALSEKADDILDDPEIDIVIELIGGLDKAKEFIIKALENKKHVVTANKALLCLNGKELFEIARNNQVNLLYEASVGGGIPVIKAIRESFQANQIYSLEGIINGTANYILTNMSEKKVSFSEALKEASERGYAEADPSLDINGIDSAHKLVILASLCFDTWVNYADVFIEGISRITAQDIQYADELGYTIKLLAICKEENNEIEARVHPTFVPKDNVIAGVKGAFNAILINGNIIGESLFYGKGAGEMATASSVFSDVIDIAKNIHNGKAPVVIKSQKNKKVKSIDDVESKTYLKIMVEDKPGVLAHIASILGEHKISISSVIQKESISNQEVPLVLMLHKAKGKNIRRALEKITKLSVVKSTITMIRVQGED